MGWRRLTCAVFGHAVDNRRFARSAAGRRCVSCGTRYLPRDASTTRVRHTLSCFLRHHTYAPTETRHGHNEYICVRCGHPLLFEAGSDPYRRSPSFRKKVRYLCGLTGHAVHEVCARNGFTEYACGCGHTFLLSRPGLARVRHPAACVTGGHRVRFVERRAGHDEYRCRDCGHPFGFSSSSSRTKSTPGPVSIVRVSSGPTSSRTVTVNGSPKNSRVLSESISALTRT